MLLINLKRIFRWGLLSFWRNPIVSLASIVTITVTLFVIGALILSGAFFNSSLLAIQEKVDISVSFYPEVPETEVLELQKTLESLVEIKSVHYSSREEELADFRQRNENNSLVIRSLDEIGNPFGARLNIISTDPGRYENVAKFLESDSSRSSSGEIIIDQISFKKDVIDRLIRIINTSKTVGWAIALVLIFTSIIVTFNTISLAIYISREEISLMKLVGAGNNYVRGPFIIEGVISGFIASIIAVVLLYPATIWIRTKTAGVYGGINLTSYFLEHFASIFLILLVSGVVLGMVASFLAIRRHLRV